MNPFKAEFTESLAGLEWYDDLYTDSSKNRPTVKTVPEMRARFQYKVLKFFDFDGRRYWRLATVWLDNIPIMVTQNAGREGDDHRKRFVTNPDQLFELIKYLHLLANKVNYQPEDVVSADHNIPYLTKFYGNSLDGYFERYRY